LVRLRVLGTSGGWPAAGRACSGYLLQGGSGLLAIDAGSGTLVELLRHASLRELDAWWISHLHADHCSDLSAVFHALAYGKQRDSRLLVFGPPGWTDWLDATVGVAGAATSVFQPVELTEGAFHEVAGLALTATETRHDPRTFGLRVAAEGQVLAYSADTGECPQLVRLARDADLFLCEAFRSWPGALQTPTSLTPQQAGMVAQLADVHRLLLTHLHPDADPEFAAAKAAEYCSGPVGVAQPGQVYDLSDCR
jgi:ribonuclease BN (tRNA processing enzyme)